MSRSPTTVRDYLRVVFRRKWWLVIGAIAGTIAAVVVWSRTPPIYLASVVVKRTNLALRGAEPVGGPSRMTPDQLRVEILTWENLNRVIREVKLDVGLVTDGQWEEQRNRVRDAIKIRAAARGHGVDLVDISVEHETPKKAAEIANAVADNYVQATQEEGKAFSEDALGFYREEADDALEKLRQVEQELAKYRVDFDYFRELPEIKTRLNDALLGLQIEKATRERELQEVKRKLEEVEKQIEETPTTILGERTREQNPEYAAIKAQLDGAKFRLQQMLTGMTEEHRAVKQAKQDIVDLEERLATTPEQMEVAEREILNPVYQQLLTQKFDYDRQVRGYEVALSVTASQIAARQEELNGVDDTNRKLTDLERERREYAERYDTFRSQRDQALVAARAKKEKGLGTDVQILARAITPASPYYAKRVKLALGCLVAGMAAGVGVVVGLELMDSSFRNREDAGEFLSPIPILGSISTLDLTVKEPSAPPPKTTPSRRRSRLVMVSGVVVFCLVCGLGLLLWESVEPGAVRKLPDRLVKLPGRLRDLPSTVRDMFRTGS